MITLAVDRVAARALRDRDEQRPQPHWGDFVLAEGLLDVWEASMQHVYFDAARDLVDAYLARGPDWGFIPWQWAGMALPALRLYGFTAETRYREFGLAVTERLCNRERRTTDGGIVTHPSKPQLWIDLLHFACPAFCARAQLTGETEYFDAATKQFRIFVSHLLDAESDLFYHVWDEETGEHSPMLWSRGNGWLTVAAVEMLARQPDDHPDRAFVAEVLKRQLGAIAGCQDASGHWHTIMDRPNSFIETSGAAIFGLAMVRGVRVGVLERSWLAPATAAWHALQDKVDEKGRVSGVTGGTPPGDFGHYQSISKGVEVFGTGLFLQLGVEMSRI